MKYKILLLTLSMLSIAPLICFSQLSFTNETSKTLYVAINWLDANSNQWMLDGWYKITSNESSILLHGHLTNSYIYFYAYSEDGLIEWAGDGSISRCIPDTKFHFTDNNEYYSQDNCHNHSFRTINTNGETRWNYPLTSKDYPYIEPQRHYYSNNNTQTYPQTQPQSSNQQPQPKQSEAPAINYVYIEKRMESCDFCAYMHNYYLHNTNSSRAILVKYECLDWSGAHISTNKITIEAGDIKSLGSDGAIGTDSKSPYSYSILSATYAD